MRQLIITLFFSLFSCALLAQKISIDQYILQFKDIAMDEMKRSGVPASITLAQGILESENGNSELVKKSNNHFGIKCKNTWTGKTVNHDDDENGECFRQYNSATESYRDHSDFLKNSSRYSALFNLDPRDYAGWARGLKKAGYATNPRYPDLLIRNIEQYGLQQYTLMALGEVSADTAGAAQNINPVSPAAADEATAVAGNTPEVLFTDKDQIRVINKARCVYATRGTSLLAIADKHHISLGKLMEFNDLTTEGLLQNDQLVYLQKKSKTGEQEYYILQPGETLYDAAQNTGIQLKYLLAYNNLMPGETVKAKTKLFLRPGFQNGLKSAGTGKAKVHQVAPKEGLYSIARTYQVTVEQLKEWNNLESDNLIIGQEIIVSK